jgi:hypothetical protein
MLGLVSVLGRGFGGFPPVLGLVSDRFIFASVLVVSLSRLGFYYTTNYQKITNNIQQQPNTFPTHLTQICCPFS